MTLQCPDCGRWFFLHLFFWRMLVESLQRDPQLKIICGICGDTELRKYPKRLGGIAP